MRISDWSSDVCSSDLDWPEKWAAFKQQRVAAGLKALAAQQSSPADIGPSLPLARYAGAYKDAWYGRIAIGQKKDGLTIDFTETPRKAGRLEHSQYDTFLTRSDTSEAPRVGQECVSTVKSRWE